MIAVREHNGCAMFRVRVQPRASREEITGERDGALRVRLQAPPVDGRANLALLRLLAVRLNVPIGAVRIVSGERSRGKTIEIRGTTAAQVRALAGTMGAPSSSAKVAGSSE